MKKLVILVAVALLAGTAFLGYGFYEKYQFIREAEPLVKNSTLRVVNNLHYDTTEGTSITFGEFFERLETDITEIEKNILQVQTIAKPGSKEIEEPVVAYLKEVQVLQRALQSKYRKLLSVDSALELGKRYMEEYKTASRYSRDTYRRSALQALEDAEKASKEMAEQAEAVSLSAIGLKEHGAAVSKLFAADAITDPELLDKIISQNSADDQNDSTGT